MVLNVVILKWYYAMDMRFLLQNLIGKEMVLNMDLLYSCKALLTFRKINLSRPVGRLIIWFCDVAPSELKLTSKPVVATVNIARPVCAFYKPSLVLHLLTLLELFIRKHCR